MKRGFTFLLAVLISGSCFADPKPVPKKIYAVALRVELNIYSKITSCEVANVFDAKSGNDNPIRFDVPEKFIVRACDKIQLKLSQEIHPTTKPFNTYVLMDPKQPDTILELE